MGFTYREPIHEHYRPNVGYGTYEHSGMAQFNTNYTAVNNPCLAEYNYLSASVAPRGSEHVQDKARASAIAGEYVNLADFLPNLIEYEYNEVKTVVDDSGCINLKSSKPKRMVTTSFKWLEAWSAYEVILVNNLGI